MSSTSDLQSLESEFKKSFDRLSAAYEKLQAAKLRSSDDKERLPEIKNAQKNVEDILAESFELAKQISQFYDNV
ncbi:MAG: hypothetical protein NTZ40_08505 [Cyanobacteria bacterium]|nr:hypothetical protein [Cyanobacteriota bacterium]